MSGIINADNATGGGVIYSTPAMQYGGFSFSSAGGGVNFELPLATIGALNAQALSFSANNTANSRGFLSRVGESALMTADNTQSRFFGFLDKGLATVSGANVNAQDRITNISNTAQQYSLYRQQAVKRKSCFITTAICELDGKPDDCEELEILRKFRDEFMMANPDTAMMVADYYKRAPAIVERIKEMPNGDAILRAIRDTYLAQAITHIRNGYPEDALNAYRQMVEVVSIAIEVQ